MLAGLLKDMTILFLVSLVGGLLLGVRVMMFGVERSREADPTAERSFRLSPAVLVSLLIAFGLVGYTLTRIGLAPSTALGISIIVAGIAATATARLVTAWWTVVPEHDVDDPRYVLQGHLARVVSPISPGSDGRISFDDG